MIEFAILLHLWRTSDEQEQNGYFSSLEKGFSTITEMDTNTTSEDLLKNDMPTTLVKNPLEMKRRNVVYNLHKIDYIAIVVYGLLFFAFNGVYWVYYLLF